MPRPGLVLTLICLPLIVCAQVLLPASAHALDQGRNDTAQHDWLQIQSSQGQQEKAAWWRALDAAELTVYLQAGADVNIADGRGWTPLHSAARYNPDPAVVRALLQAGASVNARNRSGDTPLHWAAADNHNVEIVAALLEAGADVNARDRFGWLPIHTAAEGNSNPEIIAVLLAAGAQHRRRAYYVLFRPAFLLKHNHTLSETDRNNAMAMLKGAK